MKAPITSAQAMLHPTVVDTLNALVAIADEQRALVSMLVRELRYIEGISNGQVQRVAKQALAKLPDNAGAEPREASASGNLLYDTRKNT